jgi:hypothetical protein
MIRRELRLADVYEPVGVARAGAFVVVATQQHTASRREHRASDAGHRWHTRLFRASSFWPIRRMRRGSQLHRALMTNPELGNAIASVIVHIIFWSRYAAAIDDPGERTNTFAYYH